MIQQPVFLVGAERSGTTMFRLMLAFHPQIAFLNEFEYAVDWVGDGDWPDLKGYADYLQTNRIFQAHRFHIDPALDYPALVDSFMVQHRERKQKALVGATVHRNFDKLLRIWPDARFIHIVRDPRDVARSRIGMGWSGNVWTGVAEWIEMEQLWERVRSGLTPDRYIEVRSEDLVADPPTHLDRACSLFGLRYDPAMLTYSEHSTYDAPDPTLSYQWRRKLSEREIRLVESRVGPMLAERGYEHSGLPPLEVTPWMKRQLEWQCHRYRALYRWRFLGPRLYVEDWISRHVGGPTSWRRNVTERVNEVVRASLK